MIKGIDIPCDSLRVHVNDEGLSAIARDAITEGVHLTKLPTRINM